MLTKLKSELGIDVGETTSDKEFTLGVGRCFGNCAEGPVLKVGSSLNLKTTEAMALELLRKC